MIIAILILIILALSIYVVRLRTHQEEVVKLNTVLKQLNLLIEETNKNLKLKQEEIRLQLDDTRNQVTAETKRLASLVEKNKELEQDADKRANEFYERRINELKATMTRNLEAIEEDYEKTKGPLLEKIAKYQSQLNDLERKQEAYIQAQKRQEEIAANLDYYRLAIDEVDLGDIRLLREMQAKFVKKEVIDKLIWEVYYKPQYDALMVRLSTSSKICGIYKITDLTTGLAYIGLSVDIKERFRQHIKSSLVYGKSTNKLYQTMLKSGLSNFTFEILEEVPRNKLNEREVYWINFYKTKEYGLNSTKGGS